jgi:hypothetical protein
MTAKMVIYFDCENTRRDFLNDIGELIWLDKQREEDDQRNYADKTSYVFPELDSFDSSLPDALGNRLNYSQASIAIDPRHPVNQLKKRFDA